MVDDADGEAFVSNAISRPRSFVSDDEKQDGTMLEDQSDSDAPKLAAIVRPGILRGQRSCHMRFVSDASTLVGSEGTRSPVVKDTLREGFSRELESHNRLVAALKSFQVDDVGNQAGTDPGTRSMSISKLYTKQDVDALLLSKEENHEKELIDLNTLRLREIEDVKRELDRVGGHKTHVEKRVKKMRDENQVLEEKHKSEIELRDAQPARAIQSHQDLTIKYEDLIQYRQVLVKEHKSAMELRDAQLANVIHSHQDLAARHEDLSRTYQDLATMYTALRETTGATARRRDEELKIAQHQEQVILSLRGRLQHMTGNLTTIQNQAQVINGENDELSKELTDLKKEHGYSMYKIQGMTCALEGRGYDDGNLLSLIEQKDKLYEDKCKELEKCCASYVELQKHARKERDMTKIKSAAWRERCMRLRASHNEALECKDRFGDRLTDNNKLLKSRLSRNGIVKASQSHAMFFEDENSILTNRVKELDAQLEGKAHQIALLDARERAIHNTLVDKKKEMEDLEEKNRKLSMKAQVDEMEIDAVNSDALGASTRQEDLLREARRKIVLLKNKTLAVSTTATGRRIRLRFQWEKLHQKFLLGRIQRFKRHNEALRLSSSIRDQWEAQDARAEARLRYHQRLQDLQLETATARVAQLQVQLDQRQTPTPNSEGLYQRVIEATNLRVQRLEEQLEQSMRETMLANLDKEKEKEETKNQKPDSEIAHELRELARMLWRRMRQFEQMLPVLGFRAVNTNSYRDHLADLCRFMLGVYDDNLSSGPNGPEVFHTEILPISPGDATEDASEDDPSSLETSLATMTPRTYLALLASAREADNNDNKNHDDDHCTDGCKVYEEINWQPAPPFTDFQAYQPQPSSPSPAVQPQPPPVPPPTASLPQATPTTSPAPTPSIAPVPPPLAEIQESTAELITRVRRMVNESNASVRRRERERGERRTRRAREQSEREKPREREV